MFLQENKSEWTNKFVFNVKMYNLDIIDENKDKSFIFVLFFQVRFEQIRQQLPIYKLEKQVKMTKPFVTRFNGLK